MKIPDTSIRPSVRVMQFEVLASHAREGDTCRDVEQRRYRGMSWTIDNEVMPIHLSSTCCISTHFLTCD